MCFLRNIDHVINIGSDFVFDCLCSSVDQKIRSLFCSKLRVQFVDHSVTIDIQIVIELGNGIAYYGKFGIAPF